SARVRDGSQQWDVAGHGAPRGNERLMNEAGQVPDGVAILGVGRSPQCKDRQIGQSGAALLAPTERPRSPHPPNDVHRYRAAAPSLAAVHEARSIRIRTARWRNEEVEAIDFLDALPVAPRAGQLGCLALREALYRRHAATASAGRRRKQGRDDQRTTP